MDNRVRTFVAVMVMFLLVGCATPQKMAFHDESISYEEIKNPVFLMTATLKNDLRKSRPPYLSVVNVEKAVVKSSADHLNFKTDEKSNSTAGDTPVGSRYLIRMELEPGEYVLRGLTSMNFPGTFFAPIHEKLKSSEPGIYYLGNIDATVRRRNEEKNEFRAGSIFPLIDQALAGASTGTFEISITDQWDIDGPDFKKKFPFLSKFEIQKQILPEFDRERAQKWWEEH